jgi:hypothetical protein
MNLFSNSLKSTKISLKGIIHAEKVCHVHISQHQTGFSPVLTYFIHNLHALVNFPTLSILSKAVYFFDVKKMNSFHQCTNNLACIFFLTLKYLVEKKNV